MGTDQTAKTIVTPEMIDAGMAAIWDFSCPYPAESEEAVAAAYRAMVRVWRETQLCSS